MKARDRETVWNVRFHQLAEFKGAHGHCNVPRKYAPCPDLGAWTGQQRLAKRKNKLNAEREAKLNTIGIAWDWGRPRSGSATEWDIRFKQLVAYEKKDGVACDFKLGKWICIQRHLKKVNQMSEEREAKLDSIGFDWTPRKFTPDWDLRFRQLLEYKQEFGDCNVSRKFTRNKQLAEWVTTQRMSNKKMKINKERWEKLNSVGFDWQNRQLTDINDWDVHFRDLLAHLQEHGDCNPPQGDPRNPVLARWVSEQRNEFDHKRRGEQTSLTPLREAKLDAVGFTWFVPRVDKEIVAKLKTTDNENWDVHFRELLAYLQTHGESNAPQCYPGNPLLTRWVSEQRNMYGLKRHGEQTSLTPLREAKLDAIGFAWFVGGNTEEDAPTAEGVSSSVRPEEVRSESKVKSETNGVASPDRIASG